MPTLPALPGQQAAVPAAAPPVAAPKALDPTIVNLAKAIRQTETRGQADPYTAKGASGEFGAYQYTEDTWNKDAKAYLGKAVPLTSATKEQQNEVAYKKLADLKAAGHNVGQIASIWNSGSPDWEGKVGVNSKGVKYNVPQYVDSVAQAYQAFKQGQQPTNPDTASTVGNEQIVTPQQQADQASAEQSGAFFPAVTGDSPLSAGLKAAGNMIPSAFNFGKGAINALNPVTTLDTISKIPGAFSGLMQDAGGILPALGAVAKEIPGNAYNMLVPKAAKELFSGDIEGATRDVTNDPFGTIAPFVMAAEGGAKLLDRTGITTDATGALDRGISTAAKPVTAPASYVFGKAADITGAATKLAVAKTSGLNTDTISQVADHPQNFTPEAMASLSRASLGTEVADALKTRSEAVSDTGSEYQAIRDLKAENTAPFTGTTKAIKNGTGGQSLVYNLVDAPNDSLSVPELRQKVSLLEQEKSAPPDVVKEAQMALKTRATSETVPHTVTVKPTDLGAMIKSTTGLDISKEGELTATGAASIRDAKDVRALQQFYKTWAPEFQKGNLSTSEYLNMRADLSKLSGFERELSKSTPLENLSQIMRGKFNTKYRQQIPGLEELDNKFAPMISDYKTLSKGFVDKNGNLTDAAINRIANAGGKGKDVILSRLEQISPGITLKIRTLKAIEDIQNIHKVGTYTKTALEGAGLGGGILTGNIPLIAGSIAAIILTQPEVAVRMIRAYGNYAKPLASKVLDILKAGNNVTQTQLPAMNTSVFGRQQLPAATK